jgi:hypothetical protein
MAKKIYTDQDLEALHRRGIAQLEVDEHTIVTDLAREKAALLGIRLVKPGQAVPAPEKKNNPAPASQEDLVSRVKQAVNARYPGQVDAQVLDRVVRQVLEKL